MSRIPKFPASISKENRPGLSNRIVGRNIGDGLSDADKKSLLVNHTKPLRSATTTSTVAAARLKRSATIPAPSAPSKVTKVERKPATVAPKIPPYDYKARFQDLLQKHKTMKEEYVSVKDSYGEMSEEMEKIKESAESSSSERDMLKEKLLNIMTELQEKSIENDRLKLDCELKRHENENLQRKTKVLQEMTDNYLKKSKDFDNLQIEYDEAVRCKTALKEEVHALTALNQHLKKDSIELERLKLEHKDAQELIVKYKEDFETLQNRLDSMYKEQRDLRNMVQDLKGNIRVYCRIRPPLATEASKVLFNLNILDECSIEVEKIELNSMSNSSRKGKLQQTFTFDGIFSRHSSQEDVFTEVSPMIQSALDGYNVCIFAYGQTGSGKTYTMEGGCGEEQYGIIPRAFNMIFSYMEELKLMGWELTIKATFLEIYNEIIYDLLNSSKEQCSHEIKMVNSKSTDVYVSNLKEEEVKSSHDFIGLMMFAQRNRQTAATLNNERSSRSHSVTQIKISAINEKRKEKFMSNLNLVDLAGSESGKTTQRMDETKHINRSLSELSKVILSLQTNQSHIPYRNSKLTHLLMPSLGGNSKTLMLVNINQFDECFGETLNSLRFATKVNSCRTVKAKKNITTVDTF